MDKIKLFIVDDHKMIREGLKNFLSDQPEFDIIAEAENGQDCLDQLKDLQPDVLLTDLNMPVMDGMTLIRELRAKPEFKFTPILMLTTESQDSKKQEGRAAGATGWIVKPFDPEQLMQVVNKVVR